MTQFDDREHAFEKKFGMDEETHFKQHVHAARLFGAWAAKQMKLPAADAETYVAQLGDLAVVKPGHESILAKVEKDCRAMGLDLTRHHLEKEWTECDRVAAKKSGAG